MSNRTFAALALSLAAIGIALWAVVIQQLAYMPLTSDSALEAQVAKSACIYGSALYYVINDCEAIIEPLMARPEWAACYDKDAAREAMRTTALVSGVALDVQRCLWREGLRWSEF